jgi:hypothetical protein
MNSGRLLKWAARTERVLRRYRLDASNRFSAVILSNALLFLKDYCRKNNKPIESVTFSEIMSVAYEPMRKKK